MLPSSMIRAHLSRVRSLKCIAQNNPRSLSFHFQTMFAYIFPLSTSTSGHVLVRQYTSEGPSAKKMTSETTNSHEMKPNNETKMTSKSLDCRRMGEQHMITSTDEIKYHDGSVEGKRDRDLYQKYPEPYAELCGRTGVVLLNNRTAVTMGE